MGILELFKKKRIKSTILLESYSPLCNIKAIIQEENNCVYFYLFGQPDEQQSFVKACWVRNYIEAPSEFDVNAMKLGYQPLLINSCCNHKDGAKKFDQTKLEIMWFEAGDGASLYYNNELICAIPGGIDNDCPGFSIDCIASSKYAWPLNESIISRANNAKSFWEKLNKLDWMEIQTQYLNAIEDKLGKHKQYYIIDGDNFPPKAMVICEKNEIVYILTLGLSLTPQPIVDGFIEEAKLYRRYELGFAIEKRIYDNNLDSILTFVSWLGNMPWLYVTWLGQGHTVIFDNLSSTIVQFPYTVLLNSNMLENLPKIDYPKFDDDLTNLLWIVPITEEEKKYTETNGCEALVKKALDLGNIYIFNGYDKFNL